MRSDIQSQIASVDGRAMFMRIKYNVLSSIVSDSSLEIWLLNDIEIVSKWYDSLKELTADTEFKNIDTIKSHLDNGKCLALLKSEKSVYKFTLNVLDCNEKKIPVCRINPSKIANTSKPPKFPCLEKRNATRKKRGLDNINGQNGKIFIYYLLAYPINKTN